MLYSTGAITVQKLQDAKASKTAVRLPTMINPKTGRETSRHTAFSELSWGAPTSAYLASIHKTVDNITMERIMEEAKEFSRASGGDDDSAQGSFDPDDDRANLEDGSGSGSEGEADDAPGPSRRYLSPTV